VLCLNSDTFEALIRRISREENSSADDLFFFFFFFLFRGSFHSISAKMSSRRLEGDSTCLLVFDGLMTFITDSIQKKISRELNFVMLGLC
jgi:hypothetical protein